jgi:MFS family permease
MGGAYLISAWAPSYLWVGFACALIGAGFSLCHSTIQTRATEAFPGGRGTSLALFAFSLFLGSALGSVGFGALLEHVGYGATFGTAGLLLFVFTGACLAAIAPLSSVRAVSLSAPRSASSVAASASSPDAVKPDTSGSTVPS